MIDKRAEDSRKFPKLIQDFPKQINIQEIKINIYDRLSIIIVDRDTSLAIESNDTAESIIWQKDMDKEERLQSIGLATYSNSESTVLSYTTIFEILWIRAGLSIEDQI